MTMNESSVSTDTDPTYLAKQMCIPPEILMLTLNYLSEAEFLSCKLVCQEWENWITLTEPMSSASMVLRIPHVVEKIFEHLTMGERLQSRLISESFNLVSSKYLYLKPILTDDTCKSILKIPKHFHVEDLKASSLYTNLPKTDNGIIKCSLDRTKVKSLTFYEGVIRCNKHILLQSFPNLEELKYISTNNFLFYDNIKLSFLKKLEINAAVYDENGSLRSFFSIANFPVLEIVELFVQTRQDFLLYLEVHHFIATHLKKLKKMIVIFGSDFMFIGSDIAKIFRNLPSHICNRYLEVSNIFDNNTNSLDCRLKFLRCEGISKFRLTTALYDNLKFLNPDAVILYDAPEEDLEDEDIEDELLEEEEVEEDEEDQMQGEQDDEGDDFLEERSGDGDSDDNDSENENDYFDNERYENEMGAANDYSTGFELESGSQQEDDSDEIGEDVLGIENEESLLYSQEEQRDEFEFDEFAVEVEITENQEHMNLQPDPDYDG